MKYLDAMKQLKETTTPPKQRAEVVERTVAIARNNLKKLQLDIETCREPPSEYHQKQLKETTTMKLLMMIELLLH